MMKLTLRRISAFEHRNPNLVFLSSRLISFQTTIFEE